MPALVDGDLPPLTPSSALLEHIEELHPEPPILPADAGGRVRVRALACMVACDTHPLLVPRVRGCLTAEGGFDADMVRAWMTHWVGHGLEGLEANLSGSRDTGRSCHGDRITMADICLGGLAIVGRVFKLDVPKTPTAILDRCWAEPAFAATRCSEGLNRCRSEQARKGRKP